MKKTFLLILILNSSESYSAVACSELIKSIILHKNGYLYFKSEKTCPTSWCQIKWENEGDKDRALSLLLAARAMEKSVSFYWGDINSCSEVNETYASPNYFSL